MGAVAEVQQSAKSAKRLQNEYNRMFNLVLQYNFNYWADIWVYNALLAIWVCILAAA